MSDFKLHQFVTERKRSEVFDGKLKDRKSCDIFTEISEKNRLLSPRKKNLSLSAVKKLVESSPSTEELIHQKSEGLTIEHFDGDRPTTFLSNMSENEETKITLKDSLNKSNGSATSYEKITSFINGKLSDKELKEKFLLISANKKDGSGKIKVHEDIYPLSNWVRERPYMSWNFISEKPKDFKESGPIDKLPLNVQESRLIDDVLFCLVGIEGDYIHATKVPDAKNRISFHVDETANVALKLMVQNMLPMFSYYSTVVNFIEEKTHYEQGLVNHSLAAAMRTFLRDYFILVTQLENQHLQRSLTLQKLWFYLQPSLATMETIADIATTLSEGNYHGGAVLSVLHDYTTTLTGSTKSQEICHTLTRAAALPFFEILEKWIYKGIISDYYYEFLVEDNHEIEKEDLILEYSDVYWERRYSIKLDMVPIFLSKAANMILKTGKFLNVIRECGKRVDYPNAKTIVYTTRENQYLEFIEPAYHFASQKLLDLLLEDTDLKRRLISIKHHFLLDQGDFVLQFMDMALDELQKPINEVVPSRLENLLELAQRTSILNEDRYKDDIKLKILTYDIFGQIDKMHQIHKFPVAASREYSKNDTTNMTGLDLFSFDLDVKWPASLVLSKKSMYYYQILFRNMFFCKYVESLLSRLWSLNKRTKAFPRSEICYYSSAFALRQRMLNFIQNLDYYLTLEAIEPQWNEFFSKLSQVTNVDELIMYHDKFLENCAEDCMLSNRDLLMNLSQLMKLCADFSFFLQGVIRSLMTNVDASVVDDSMLFSMNEQIQSDVASGPASLESFQQQVSNFEKEFDQRMHKFLKALQNFNQLRGSDKCVTMLHRLNFNGFYGETDDYEESDLDGKE